MTKNSRYIYLFLIAIYLTPACTTINYTTTEEFHTYLNNQKGNMTYDQALMIWGQPVSMFDGDSIFIVNWGAESSSNVIAPVGNTIMAFPIKDGWNLQLGFSKKTRKLVSWKYEKW